ncbi:hypothetical protein B9Q06_12270 [Candidatus Marsarchaeota G2 archaeon ECH_B_2]|uniref:Uncharacterized protein n=3 Tax=Candidatus Marsarchaeota group 2 TaxID=2203771 RepID=A0A2R6B4B4_9ARCH|nr:MAG: hypothetical protein B9Q06_12270 [Candidatus Marsarchaeota G2 archaeon ECH_B_2]PSN97621.1 MAG: hypothetical protein B9Q07_11780 [Candidatus Marsarchaeota G2 archaeon ECH_B_3]PSO02738.1 MAG: hypothetical protein B9Q05_04330 [Candidatus Marsarchaeota G2 archaeon ECH_B_1]
MNQKSLGVVAVALLFASITIFAYASPLAVSTYTIQAQSGYLIDVYWEVAPAGGCGGPPLQPALSETYPTAKQSRSYPLGAAPTCVWGPQYTSTESYTGGPCLLVIYIKAKGAATVTYALEITNNKGVAITTVAKGTLDIASSNTPAEYTSVSTCVGFTAQAGDYLVLSLSDPPGPGPGPGGSVTVYFGPTTPTDVQVTQSADTA